MRDINFFDIKGNKITADLIFSLNVSSLNKTFVAINNGDLIFDQGSSYNNLDVLELVREDGNSFYITDIQEEDWEFVKQAIIDEFLSKIN